MLLAMWLLVFVCLLRAPDISTVSLIGTVLLEGRHNHFRAIVPAVRSALALQLSLRDMAISDDHVIFLKNSTPFSVAQAIGYLRAQNVSVVVGPPEKDFGELIQSVCEELGLPYLSYYLDSRRHVGPTVFRLFPSAEYSRMMQNLLNYWRWNRFSVIYSKSSSLRNVDFFISRSNADVVFIEVDDSPTQMHAILKAGTDMREQCNLDKCWRTTNRALVELDTASTYAFLESCLKLGLINADNWFYLLSVDNVEHGLEPFSHNMMRLSVAGQFDETLLRQNSSYHSLVQAFESKMAVNQLNVTNLSDLVAFHDAIASTELVVRSLGTKGTTNDTAQGLTGTLRFDQSRMRADAAFHIIEMGVDGRQINTGLWHTNSRQLQRVLSMTDKTSPNTHESMMEETKTQRLLKVVSIEERPYVMKKTLPNGRIVHEGFCIDLLNRLAHDLNFEYKLTIVPDGKYGEPINGTKEWDGLIGELLRGEATAAVAPITVTAGRLEVVDFTDPFLQLGISMLMRIPDEHKASSSFLSFLWPLSPSIWMYWALVTVASVITVTTIAILSPEESARRFNSMNSVWYLICILLRAGSGYNCHSVSNRIVSTAWWAFTLILIAQYTANFAAVLTVDRKTLPFNSFEELGNQTEYDFGTIHGGSTMQFFMYSRLDTFQRIWLRMQNMSKSVFVETNQQGVQKVLAEKYVFLMESASLEYQLTQHCNLTKVGNVVLGSNGYSIALPKGSKWREQLSRQILDYNEKGIMMMLKRTWWKKTPQIEECEEKAVETRKSLGMDKVSGIFGLLGIGLIMALVVAFSEKVILLKAKQSTETILVVK